MKIPYRYRGAAYLTLLVLLLPWLAWHYAFRDTLRMGLECRRLAAELAEAVPTTASTAPRRTAPTAGPELILSGMLLDTLQQRVTQHGIAVAGYVPVVTSCRENMELHTAQLTLTGRFIDLLPLLQQVEQLPQCRLRSAVWQSAIDRNTRQRQLSVTLYIQQITLIK